MGHWRHRHPAGDLALGTTRSGSLRRRPISLQALWLTGTPVLGDGLEPARPRMSASRSVCATTTSSLHRPGGHVDGRCQDLGDLLWRAGAFRERRPGAVSPGVIAVLTALRATPLAITEVPPEITRPRSGSRRSRRPAHPAAWSCLARYRVFVGVCDDVGQLGEVAILRHHGDSHV